MATWGLVWLIGYAALALYRETDYSLLTAPYLFFCGYPATALLFTFTCIVPKTYSIRGRSSCEGTYYGLTWNLGVPLEAVIFSRVNIFLSIFNTSGANEVMSMVSNAVPCLIVGVIFLMSAVPWNEAAVGILGG